MQCFDVLLWGFALPACFALCSSGRNMASTLHWGSLAMGLALCVEMQATTCVHVLLCRLQLHPKVRAQPLVRQPERVHINRSLSHLWTLFLAIFGSEIHSSKLLPRPLHRRANSAGIRRIHQPHLVLPPRRVTKWQARLLTFLRQCKGGVIARLLCVLIRIRLEHQVGRRRIGTG